MASDYKTADSSRPAERTLTITTSDVTRYRTARAIWVGVSGNVNVVHPDGTTFIYVAAPVGVLPVQNIGVMATSTTATSLGAMY